MLSVIGLLFVTSCVLVIGLSLKGDNRMSGGGQ